MMIQRPTFVLMAVTFVAGLCVDSAILRVGAQTAARQS